MTPMTYDPDSSRGGVATESPRLLVIGSGGILEGIRQMVRPGGTLVLGRSRSCDVSMRRSPGFLAHSRPLSLLKSEPFRKISRIHCEVTLLPDGRIEVRDLSRNGTFVDGATVVGSCILSADEKVVRLQLADGRLGSLLLIRGRG